VLQLKIIILLIILKHLVKHYIIRLLLLFYLEINIFIKHFFEINRIIILSKYSWRIVGQTIFYHFSTGSKEALITFYVSVLYNISHCIWNIYILYIKIMESYNFEINAFIRPIVETK